MGDGVEFVEPNEDAVDIAFDAKVKSFYYLFDEALSNPSKENERLSELNQQTLEDSQKPWLNAKPLYCMRAWTDDDAAACLVASIYKRPPDVSKKKNTWE